jgi:hypothetical protein
MSVPEQSYIEGAMKLTSRLTNFPIAVGVYEKNQQVNRLYFEDEVAFKELQGFFRPITPRFIMPEKEFRSLNNNSRQAFIPGLSATTSNSFGAPIYSLTLFSISFLEGATWLFLSLLLLALMKIIFDKIEKYRGQMNILFFILLFDFYYAGALENFMGGTYAYMIFILPTLLVLRIAKPKKEIQDVQYESA